MLFFLILGALFVGISVPLTYATKVRGITLNDRNRCYRDLAGEPENSIDVLVLGDSLSYSAISPIQLWSDTGMTSLVCGQPGQRTKEAYDVLKTALKRQSPRLVIIETNELFRAEKGLEGLKETIAGKAQEYFPVLRFHNVWKSLILRETDSREFVKGFKLRKGVQPYTGGKYMKKTRRERELPETVRADMEKILGLCRENEIEVLLLSTPSPKNYSYREHNALKQYAGEQSVGYLDLNLKMKKVGIDWHTDSLDGGDHLNLSGACKVTEYLGKYLQKKYRIPDHREERGYESWQRETAEYHVRKREIQ